MEQKLGSWNDILGILNRLQIVQADSENKYCVPEQLSELYLFWHNRIGGTGRG